LKKEESHLNHWGGKYLVGRKKKWIAWASKRETKLKRESTIREGPFGIVADIFVWEGRIEGGKGKKK